VLKEKTFIVNVKPSSFINYGAIKKVQLFLLMMMMIVDVLSARNQRLSHCSNFTRIKCVSARNQRESFGNSLKEWSTVMYDVSCYQIASFARFLFLAKKVFSFFTALQLQCTSCIEKIPALKKIIFFNVNAS